jgi:hypothetical protein
MKIVGTKLMNKHSKISCNKCKDYKQKLLQYKNLKHYWKKECAQFDCKLSIAKEKCRGNYFNKRYTTKKDMKVVKMIMWEDAQNYPQCDDQNNYKEFWDCVKKSLINKNIKFNGSWHQGWEYGTPLVEYEGKLYAFAVTMRRWGKIMADAFDPGNKDPGAYLKWAFYNPDGERPTVDENKDPLLGSENT